METAPATAVRNFAKDYAPLLMRASFFNFTLQVGDQIKIGDVEFTIAGALKKMPGEASAGAIFAPRVYIPLQNLEATHLIKPGSVARYRAYVKFPRRRRC